MINARGVSDCADGSTCVRAKVLLDVNKVGSEHFGAKQVAELEAFS